MSGKPIGVGSDVYSLGVVLHEMLTGARPYRVARDSPAALEEAILHAEPARPSEVAADREARRSLRGDLDTIVLRALKKRPEERYATVDAFAEDVELWLAGRPVKAQPDRRTYRLGKFVRRNRLAVGAAGAVVAAVLVGTSVSIWQARVAVAEKERAEEVKELIASIFRDADPYAGSGKVPTAADLLRNAQQRIRGQFGSRPDVRIELLTFVGSSLIALQDFASAEPVVREAVEVGRTTLGGEHPRTVRARMLLIQILRYRGKPEQMLSEIDDLERLFRRRPALHAENLVVVLRDRAHAAIDQGRSEEAVRHAREATELSRARFGEVHRETAVCYGLLGLAHHLAKEPDLALEAAEKGDRLLVDARGGERKHPDVIDARSIFGRSLAAAGQLERGIEELLAAAGDACEVFGRSSMMVGFFLGTAATYQIEAGHTAAAVASAREAWRVLSEQVEPRSFTAAAAEHNLGAALLAARRAAEAERHLARAAPILRDVVGPAHEKTLTARANRALALAHLGRLREAEGEVAPALEPFERFRGASVDRAAEVLGVTRRLAGDPQGALELSRRALQSVPPGPRSERHRARVAAEVGLAQVELGDHGAAVETLERAVLAFREARMLETPQGADARVGLGRARMGLGRPTEALPALESADAFWRGFDPESRWAGEAALWLGRCLSALGRGSEAERELARAARILARSPIPSDAKLVRLSRAR